MADEFVVRLVVGDVVERDDEKIEPDGSAEDDFGKPDEHGRKISPERMHWSQWRE
jgi:hypothetical protein